MKKIIGFLACLILPFVLGIAIFMVVIWITSYEVEYPETYTVEYCKENYVPANPQLVAFKIADNSVEDIWRDDIYIAIKNVPTEDYLYHKNNIFLTTSHTEIVRNKNLVLPEDELLFYEYKSLELYVNGNQYNLSNTELKKSTGDKADSFRAYIQECLESGNYKKFSFDPNIVSHAYANEKFSIILEIKFSEHPYLGWGSEIYQFTDGDPNYYFLFARFVVDESHPDGYYKRLCIPLPEDLAKLIPET